MLVLNFIEEIQKMKEIPANLTFIFVICNAMMRIPYKINI